MKRELNRRAFLKTSGVGYASLLLNRAGLAKSTEH